MLTIAELIGCPKRIVKQPEKMKRDRGSWRTDMSLKMDGGEEVFDVFVRLSARDPENFSCGLLWHSRDPDLGVLLLFRVNGKHGREDLRSNDGHYAAFHYHYLTDEDVELGMREPRRCKIVSDYNNLRGAWLFFAKRVNIADDAARLYQRFGAPMHQQQLDFGEP